MNIDDRLRSASNRLNASLEGTDIPPAPQRRHRRWVATAFAVAALSAGIVGVVVIASGPVGDRATGDDVFTSSSTTTSLVATRTRTYINRNVGYSISYPVGWDRTLEHLAPTSSPSTPETQQVLAIGSGPLIPGASAACQDIPQNAIEAMGADDVLITIVNAPGPGAPWPESFEPDAFPDSSEILDRTQACTGRPDLVVWQGDFSIGEEHSTVLVVSTLTAPEPELNKVWATLDSFALVDPGNSDPFIAVPAWTIAYQGDWYRADSDLMPNLGWDSITLGTFELRPGGERCAQVPENSMRDMGAADALVTVFFAGLANEGLAWPTNGFDDQVFPESRDTEVDDCAERQDLEIHWGAWFQGTGNFVLVAFGSEVSPETRAETWRVLSSLKRTSPRAADNCVATVPAEPDWVPPERWPEFPFDPESGWFGTPDLWTPLPYSGVYRERKSVWWSQNFTNPGVESQPLISAMYESLDQPGWVIQSDGPGTNAFTDEDGVFMIANIDFEPPAPGCWRVTAEYKGATTSYVIDVP